MSRITDANMFFAGSEPRFSEEVTESQLTRALNWYSQNKDKKDAFKYANDYFKKKLKVEASHIIKDKDPTFGFICRIVNNGAKLNLKNQSWFEKEVDNVKQLLKIKIIPKVVDVAVKTNTPNIQDRIKEKASDCIGELEGLVDDLIISKFKQEVSPYGLMKNLDIKVAQVKIITDWAKNKRMHFNDVLNTNDKELKEGYSNFSKSDLKKVISYFDQVILDCQKISGDSLKTRKPRKVKQKTPEQLVSKLKFMDSFVEFNLKSIKSTEIIGCMTLWVYNTKTRKLGVYHAEDAGGLTVKGSSIENFNATKSVQKTLRKPADVLSEILNGGKVYLRNAMSNIRAVESNLTGRINSDTILLKVTK
jgi:hypothetical protein